jgi:thymidine phosphorylase
VREAGCAIIGQTPDLAPADKRIYSIRDTTATVESLDLITASILSKKIAAGLDGLVMDVKFGSGAFMRDYDKARELAQSIATVATGAGVKTTALLTDMNQVLGRTAGNALEMQECIDWLTGRAQPEARLAVVTYTLAAELLVLGGLASDMNEALNKCCKAVESGMAAERFARMVYALGGPERSGCTINDSRPIRFETNRCLHFKLSWQSARSGNKSLQIQKRIFTQQSHCY